MSEKTMGSLNARLSACGWAVCVLGVASLASGQGAGNAPARAPAAQAHETITPAEQLPE
jgi:hypothetical protein